MALQDTTVCNTNLLQSAKFLFNIPRLTSTQFFAQSVNIPGVIVEDSPKQPTPFLDLAVPGDKMDFDDLTVEFLLDEELWSWTTIYDWIEGISFPTSFQDYSNLPHLSKYSETTPYPQYADAEIVILTAFNQPKVKFRFIDVFPVSLSGFPMDVRVSSEKTLTATATFKFKKYEIIRI